MEKKKILSKEKIIIVCVAVVALIAIIVIAMNVNANKSNNELQKLLDLGNKYLAEMDYEQAIVAFQNAIDIDPKCEDAYDALIDIYIELGDYDSALEITQMAMENVDNVDYFAERIIEVNELVNQQQLLAKEKNEIDKTKIEQKDKVDVSEEETSELNTETSENEQEKSTSIQEEVDENQESSETSTQTENENTDTSNVSANETNYAQTGVAYPISLVVVGYFDEEGNYDPYNAGNYDLEYKVNNMAISYFDDVNKYAKAVNGYEWRVGSIKLTETEDVSYYTGEMQYGQFGYRVGIAGATNWDEDWSDDVDQYFPNFDYIGNDMYSSKYDLTGADGSVKTGYVVYIKNYDNVETNYYFYYMVPENYTGDVTLTIYGSKLENGEIVRNYDNAYTFLVK